MSSIGFHWTLRCTIAVEMVNCYRFVFHIVMDWLSFEGSGIFIGPKQLITVGGSCTSDAIEIRKSYSLIFKLFQMIS